MDTATGMLTFESSDLAPIDYQPERKITIKVIGSIGDFI